MTSATLTAAPEGPMTAVFERLSRELFGLHIELTPFDQVIIKAPAGTPDVFERFERLCQELHDVRMELTANEEIVIMAPAAAESGELELDLGHQFKAYVLQTRNGRVFGPSAGFRLANGAVLSPDASWIASARYAEVPRADRRRFPPICPDVVAELMSPSDRLSEAQEKLREWVAQGARLAWLIDPDSGRVEVHRPGRDVEVLDRPDFLSGEDVMPGFVLDLRPIFNLDLDVD